jgi:hypothetical protein
VSQLTPEEFTAAMAVEIRKLMSAKNTSERVWSGLSERAFKEDRLPWRRDAPRWWYWLPFVGIISQQLRKSLYDDWDNRRRERFWRFRRARGFGRWP